MTLYHFCSAGHLGAIMTKGAITEGVFWLKFVDGAPTGLRNRQSLTLNPDFDQSWDSGRHRLKNVPYRRTEYRIGISIPPDAIKRLSKFSDLCDRLKPESEAFQKSETDWKHWYI